MNFLPQKTFFWIKKLLISLNIFCSGGKINFIIYHGKNNL